MIDYLSINYTITEIIGYKISLVEFLGTLAGIVAVVLETRSNIWTWPVGIVNIIFSFFVFYQTSLYSDMMLQFYYFATAIYGWIYWHGIKTETQTPITLITKRGRIIHTLLIITGTVGIGYFISKIHVILPDLFPTPASYPYPDTFVAVLSILANWMMAQRKIETWILWIVIDVICTVMYSLKGIQFFALEYLLFTLMAVYGLINWIKLYKGNQYSNPAKVESTLRSDVLI
jgi:nicotinamide mononucleotide transporter